MEVLFYLNTNYIYIISSHSPHGECGLKYGIGMIISGSTLSLPTRGVWIEIGMLWLNLMPYPSLPTRGVWIEIHPSFAPMPDAQSLPTRGVWIEINTHTQLGAGRYPVTPHTGSVD